MFIRFLTFLGTTLALCLGGMPGEARASGDKLIIYTTRDSAADVAVFKEFSKTTGMAVEIVSGKSGEIVKHLEGEGDAPKADIVITVDGGVLDGLKQKGLLQPVTAQQVLDQVPASLRDKDNHWIGMTTRARVIVYSKDRVQPGQLSTYEDLADPRWKGKIVMRPGSALYNVSLTASLIELDGEKAAEEWIKGVVGNFARQPKGGDRGQAKDIAAGTGDVTLMNTYYIGRMLNGKDEEERKVAQNVGVFFPNQETTGAHINICGVAVTKNAAHRAGAEKFIAYLTDAPAQSRLSAGNFEYPVNPKAKKAGLLEEWGGFKAQVIDFSVLNKNKALAKELLSGGGWE